ncbi:MAG: hypothetical protein M3O64_00620 [Chloroflexota bacterium]|nr:hypothetical protein [Chloroflexota bacterium]
MEGPTFHWASPLGVGVALLLGWGAINAIIGVLAPIVGRGPLVADILVLSPRTDAAMFGGDPNSLVREFPALLALQRVLLVWLGASLAAFGLLIIAVTWFGLRRGEPWALPVLAACWLLVLAGFALLFKRYVDAGVTLSLGDLPPLFHYPAFLVTPAIVLSWIGLR